MDIDKVFQNQLIKITQEAAISVYPHLGKNNKIIADEAATNSMRTNLNKMNIRGNIVIGEGEMDEAPMLYIGEKVGTKKGPEFDIAVDPLEGTNFAANNLPGALSMMAISEKNNLFNAPETYMEKISSNVKVNDVVDLDFSVKKNIYNLSDYLNKKPDQLTVCILDRLRHKDIIDELNKLKVNIKLITDGDVSGALLVTDEKYKVDLFLGIGGGPEGVLAASALDTFNCNFQGRFLFKTEEDKIRAKKMGIKDLTKKYQLDEIVTGDSIFCATGITSGDLVSGIKIEGDEFISETLITHKSSNIKQIFKSKKKIL